MKSENKCPFCGANLITEDHCHSCNAFQIKGYVSREARTRIKLISACVSLIIGLVAAFIAFLASVNIGVYILILVFSVVFLFALNRLLFTKEVKKGKVVWKRAMVAW